eukprot:gene8366-14340_t
MSNEETRQLRKLVALRGGNRTVVTKLDTQGNEIFDKLRTTEFNADFAFKLQSIGTTLNEKKLLLEELNKEIIDKCSIEEIEKEIVETAEWDSRLNEIIEKIKYFTNGRLTQPSANGAGREEAPTPLRAHGSINQDLPLRSNENRFHKLPNGVNLRIENDGREIKVVHHDRLSPFVDNELRGEETDQLPNHTSQSTNHSTDGLDDTASELSSEDDSSYSEDSEESGHEFVDGNGYMMQIQQILAIMRTSSDEKRTIEIAQKASFLTRKRGLFSLRM